MNLADLDKVIKLEVEVGASDGMGGSTTVWKTTHTLRAKEWPVSPREIKQDSQIINTINNSWRTRYAEGITTSYRVNYENKYENIVAVIPVGGGREWMDIMTKKVVT